MKKFLSTLLYTAAATLLFSACGMTANTVSSPVEPTVKSNEKTAVNNKALVYFSKDISPVSLIKLYDKINQDIHGKVAIKIHTGEKNGPNILPREIVMALQQHVPDSNLVETNTFYKGDRYTTAGHRETLKVNGWDFCTVDIMDEEGAVMLPVKGGKHFQEMSIAKNMLNYDSMIVLTHFKGHTMGGFGGSMKNIAIGNADGRIGKAMLHTSDPSNPWEYSQERFMENMAESAKATTDFFGKQIIYINVLRNMSVDCDCAGLAAAPPTTPDIGILASTDILAVDQASIDLVFALPDAAKHDLQERIESRRGLRQLSYMKELSMGNDQYELPLNTRKAAVKRQLFYYSFSNSPIKKLVSAFNNLTFLILPHSSASDRT